MYMNVKRTSGIALFCAGRYYIAPLRSAFASVSDATMSRDNARVFTYPSPLPSDLALTRNPASEDSAAGFVIRRKTSAIERREECEAAP